MTKGLLVLLLTLCIAYPARSLADSSKCSPWYLRLSLRGFLGTAFVGAVGFAWYGNRKRHWEAYLDWSEPVRVGSKSISDEYMYEIMTKRHGLEALQTETSLNVLRDVIEGDEVFRARAKELDVNWKHLERRAAEYRKQRDKLGGQDPKYFEERMLNLDFKFWPEWKVLSELYNSIYATERADFTSPARLELNRLEKIAVGKRLVSDSNARGLLVSPMTPEVASAWMTSQGVSRDEFLKHIVLEEADLDDARATLDERYKPHSKKINLESTLTAAWRREEKAQGKSLSFQDFLDALKLRVELKRATKK